MGGDLHWNEDEHPHDRLLLELEGGTLAYRNMRKFGGVWLARDRRKLGGLVGSLGPDWLDISRHAFDELLARRRGSVKAALMDQRLAAGLGNLTADEALWQAGIDPARPVSSLSDSERDTRFRKIDTVLRDSLPYGLVPSKRLGDMPRAWHADRSE